MEGNLARQEKSGLGRSTPRSAPRPVPKLDPGLRFVNLAEWALKKSEGADAAEGNRDAPDTNPGKEKGARAGSLAPHHVTTEGT
jgi:hypothetical protein